MKWQMLFDKVSKSGDTKEKVIKNESMTRVNPTVSADYK